jgi:hypothetical protein
MYEVNNTPRQDHQSHGTMVKGKIDPPPDSKYRRAWINYKGVKRLREREGEESLSLYQLTGEGVRTQYYDSKKLWDQLGSYVFIIYLFAVFFFYIKIRLFSDPDYVYEHIILPCYAIAQPYIHGSI